MFVDMALGKTAITLTAIVNMLALGLIPDGVLLVAPLNVTKDTWQQEALLWTHLRNLKFILIEGKDQNERLRLLQSKADIKIISYTLLPWLGRLLDPKKLRRTGKPYWLPTMLVLDESEFIKGRGSWFKVLRNRVIRYTKYRVIQTGTPAAHSLFDLWPQLFIIDKGARLSSSFDNYRGRFFEQDDYQGYRYVPRKGAEKRIYKLIDDVIVRLDGKDWLELPEIVPQTIYVDLPSRAMQLYRKHEKEMFIQLDNLKEIEAINAAVLSGQCWQLAGGAIYDDPELRESWSEIHRAKLDALKELIEGAVGNPAIVAYWFRHERARLQREYPKATFVTKDNVIDIKAKWNKGQIPLLFMNPQQSAHGLNMQFGGHRVFWYTQIWSGGRHDQLLARLRRPDQQSPHILTYYITARNTVDEVIAESREQRLRGQAALLDALRRYQRKRYR